MIGKKISWCFLAYNRKTAMLRFFALLFIAFSVSASLTSCPSIKATAHNSKISAVWDNYNPKEIVAFEWAVVEGKFSTGGLLFSPLKTKSIFQILFLFLY